MVYADWDAFVYRNGERYEEGEDVQPFPEMPGGPTYHHAVLGEGDVRLCAYQNYPVILLYVREGMYKDTIFEVPFGQFRVDKNIPLPDWGWYEAANINGIQGEMDGYKFSAQHAGEDRTQLALKLVEPDGTIWTATVKRTSSRGASL